jgi:hypothetical protein
MNAFVMTFLAKALANQFSVYAGLDVECVDGGRDTQILFMIQTTLLENGRNDVDNQNSDENINTKSTAVVLPAPQVFALQNSLLW